MVRKNIVVIGSSNTDMTVVADRLPVPGETVLGGKFTMGSRGSMVYCQEQPVFIPSIKVDAVDTTAAGDTYCGGLCVALAEGKDIII